MGVFRYVLGRIDTQTLNKKVLQFFLYFNPKLNLKIW